MSIEVIKNQIDRFLGCDTPGVLSIKGGWGVGKTYSWNKFLIDAKNNNGIALKRYSYVSLFGLNSLETFKHAIFENVLTTDLIGHEASVETLNKNVLSLFEVGGRKGKKLLKEMPYISNISSILDSLSFLSLSKTLICIDDLERKGSGLELRDVLGLVSLLKEQKKCKIVIVVNDGEIGLEDYVTYREKVVDIELAFALTDEECVSIALNKDGLEFDTLRESCKKLKIKNIRVLKKIERMVDLVKPVLAGFEDEIKIAVVHSLTLFSWCYLCSRESKSIPTFEYVTQLDYYFSSNIKRDSLDNIFEARGDGDGDGDEVDFKKIWDATIRDYGYRATDELDIVLAEAVKTGYFVDSDVAREASKKNAEILASKGQGSFSDAWEIYHNSFDDNSEAVISGLYDSFKRNARYISLTNLNGAVTLFRELGDTAKASDMIDIYIEKRKDQVEFFNLDKHHIVGDSLDAELADKFNAAYTARESIETASEVLARIARKDGWNPSDEVLLANTSSEEYYDLFKSGKGDNFSSCIDACLNFGRYANSTDRQLLIANRAKEALKKIASESELNRLRVKKFGIELPKD